MISSLRALHAHALMNFLRASGFTTFHGYLFELALLNPERLL